MNSAPRRLHRALRIGLIALGALLGAGGVVGVWLTYFGVWSIDRGGTTRTPPPTPETVASVERKRRETPVAAIAPAPLPTALPLRGEPGARPDGYPTQWVDKPALRSLLFHRKHDELTRYMEELQTSFEADPKKEYWAIDSAHAFDTADPSLAAELDAWVGAKPESFAAWLARGVFRVAVGFAKRGTKARADTHDDDFAGMHEAHAAARSDLEEALKRNPKTIAAAWGLQMVENSGGRPADEVAARERSFAMCPTCMQVRYAAIVHSAPKWGGSLEEMKRLADAAPVGQNPRLALLQAVIELEEADALQREKKAEEALAAVERACKRGAYSASLAERAELRWKRDDLDGALRDIDAALVDRPGSVPLLEIRAGILLKRKEWQRATEDLVAVLRVDSTSREARRLKAYAVQGLLAEAEAQAKRSDTGKALDTFDLAATLSPFSRQVQMRRQELILGGPVTDASIAEAEKAVADAPGDFRRAQRLDYLVSGRRDWKRILGIWDAYLKLRPDDGRAYLERNGTHTNMKSWDLAEADARRACELGVSEGCARSKLIKEKLAPAPAASP